MGRVVFLEILDRRGRVRERVRLQALPATVGRAYTNDVILEDRFVSPEHCCIRENDRGEFLVDDLSSLNGIRELGELASVEPSRSILLRSGERFRLGETVLRILDGSHPVAPAEPLPEEEGGFLSSLRDGRLALLVVASSLLVLAVDEYLASYHDTSFPAVMRTVAGALAGLAVWAGIWAFANRLLNQRFDFLRHLACASLAVAAGMGARVLAEYAEFLLSSGELGSGIEVGGYWLSTMALFSAQLAILRASTRRQRRWWALAGTAVLAGLLGLAATEDSEDLVSEVPITSPLKPLGADWIPAVSMAEFLERSRWVRETVDSEAAEGPR